MWLMCTVSQSTILHWQRSGQPANIDKATWTLLLSITKYVLDMTRRTRHFTTTWRVFSWTRNNFKRLLTYWSLHQVSGRSQSYGQIYRGSSNWAISHRTIRSILFHNWVLPWINTHSTGTTKRTDWSIALNYLLMWAHPTPSPYKTKSSSVSHLWISSHPKNEID
jgi:hypothetical protein